MRRFGLYTFAVLAAVGSGCRQSSAPQPPSAPPSPPVVSVSKAIGACEEDLAHGSTHQLGNWRLRLPPGFKLTEVSSDRWTAVPEGCVSVAKQLTLRRALPGPRNGRRDASSFLQEEEARLEAEFGPLQRVVPAEETSRYVLVRLRGDAAKGREFLVSVAWTPAEVLIWTYELGGEIEEGTAAVVTDSATSAVFTYGH